MDGEPIALDWCFINVNKKSNKKIERFWLHAEKKGRREGRPLVAFMMNPSYAGIENNKLSDKTVNMILRTLGSNYRDVYIINNIPISESQSNNLSENILKNYNFKYNEEAIEQLINCFEEYDLYVGAGIKGSGYGFDNKTNLKIRQSYIKNMDILCHRSKCINIYTSGLNANGVSQHPKLHNMSNDVAEFLLQSRRITCWNSNEKKLERK